MASSPAELCLSVNFVTKEWQIRVEAYDHVLLIAALALILPGTWAGCTHVGITHGAHDTNRKLIYTFSGRALDRKDSH